MNLKPKFPSAIAESGSEDYAVPVEIPQSPEATAAHHAPLQRVRAQGVAPLSRELRRRPQEAIQQHVSSVKDLHVPVDGGISEFLSSIPKRYIPSDFFLADHSWNKTFPIHAPFKLHHPASFHVFSKDHVDQPSDSRYLLS